MEYLKILIIVAVILIYWAFIYYRFHRSDYTPISMLAGGLVLAAFGVYGLVNGKVFLSDISLVYFVLLIFLTGSCVLVGSGSRKRGLSKQIDVTMTFWKKKANWIPRFFMVFTYPLFLFMMLGTRFLLGPEHVFAWGMIFLAWTVSGIKLIRYIMKSF